jgi:hypothetical protein
MPRPFSLRLRASAFLFPSLFPVLSAFQHLFPTKKGRTTDAASFATSASCPVLFSVAGRRLTGRRFFVFYILAGTYQILALLSRAFSAHPEITWELQSPADGLAEKYVDTGKLAGENKDMTEAVPRRSPASGALIKSLPPRWQRCAPRGYLHSPEDPKTPGNSTGNVPAASHLAERKDDSHEERCRHDRKREGAPSR